MTYNGYDITNKMVSGNEGLTPQMAIFHNQENGDPPLNFGGSPEFSDKTT